MPKRGVNKTLVAIAIAFALLFGCIVPDQKGASVQGAAGQPAADAPGAQTAAGRPVQEQPANPSDSDLSGNWRVYSSYIYYRSGLANHYGAVSTSRQLEIGKSGTWKYGDSSGGWSVGEIQGGDWEKWKTSPFGPSKKIILSNWGGQTVDGPIEESGGRADFLWLIYYADVPSEDGAQIQIKFGHGYG